MKYIALICLLGWIPIGALGIVIHECVETCMKYKLEIEKRKINY